MINHITGKVTYIYRNYIIIECNGLGYKVNFRENGTKELKLNENKRIFIHEIIKNDLKNHIVCDLYGFLSPIERTLFANLLTINGIGPMIANNILEYDYKQIIMFITNEDIESLTKIKGVNEKIARQIIANLIDQYEKIAETLDIKQIAFNPNNELNSALKQLGYSNREIEIAQKQIDHNLDLEEQIGKSIRIIAGINGSN